MTANILDPATRTADQWQLLAQDARDRLAESWEASDTDGFLTQAANDHYARIYATCAKLAQNNCEHEFVRPARITGDTLTLVDAYPVAGRYGLSWAIRTDGGTEWFNPSTARNGERRRAADARKGFTYAVVSGPAVVSITGWAYTIVPKRNAPMTLIGPATYENE